eukprot:360138-Chlamydomonas_euryale.AAC.4
MLQDVPTPLVEFQLFETGRTPIPPPLSRAFAVIEQQREEEAAMGEQPLEAVLAPVPVPLEIAPPAPPPEDQLRAAAGDLFAPAVMPEPLDVGPHPDQRFGAPQWGSPPPPQPSVDPAMRDLADAMQRQLTMLTRAVEELRDERKSLRNSVLAL